MALPQTLNIMIMQYALWPTKYNVVSMLINTIMNKNNPTQRRQAMAELLPTTSNVQVHYFHEHTSTQKERNGTMLTIGKGPPCWPPLSHTNIYNFIQNNNQAIIPS